MSTDNSSACYPYFNVENSGFYKDYPIVVNVNLFLFVTGVIYVVVSLARFYYYQGIYIRLQKRSFLLQLLLSIGVLFQFCGASLFEAVSMVCWVGVVLRSLVVPVTALPIPIRLLDYYNRYVLAETLLKRNKLVTPPSPEKKRPFLRTFFGKKLNDQDGSIGNISGSAVSTNAHKSLIKIIEVAENMPENTQPNESIDSSLTPEQNASIDSFSNWENDKLIYYLKLLSSTKMRFVIFVLMLIPFLIVVIVDFATVPYLFPSSHCFNCVLTANLGYLIIVGGVGIILLGVVFASVVRKYPDPFGVVRECRIVLQYGALFALVGFILHRVYPTTSFDNFSFGWVTHVGFFLIQFLTTDYQIWICKTHKTEVEIRRVLTLKKNKKMFNKSEADGRTSDLKALDSQVSNTFGEADINSQAALITLLADPIERDLFEKHLISEFAVENIIMYQEIEKFERSFFDFNENTRRARAKRFVDQFVREDSIMQVNIPYIIRRTIIETIESDKPIHIDIFKTAKKELLGMLFGSYLRYIHSDIFKKAHENALL